MCKPKKASMTEIVRAPSGFGMQNMTTDVLMRRTIAATESKVSPLKTFYFLTISHIWCHLHSQLCLKNAYDVII